ncbi:MAG TPA: TetR family transcriptional regulator, partial [Nocardioides sp.]|nr:TetR family transcriptional regulator [Nocardioides sp.]
MTTRDKLVRATQEALVEDGIAHLSARTVAARAGVNQALVFYHFGTVSELVEAAARALSDASIDHYRGRFAAVDSLT